MFCSRDAIMKATYDDTVNQTCTFYQIGHLLSYLLDRTLAKRSTHVKKNRTYLTSPGFIKRGRTAAAKSLNRTQ